MQKAKLSFIKVLLLSLFFLPFGAHANQVAKVKGKKVLIKVEGEIQKGKYYYLINEQGKKRGILKVMKVKGSKAIGLVRKGKAKAGWSLELRSKGQTAEAKPKSDEYQPGQGENQAAFYLGALAGYAINNMSVAFETNVEEVSMTGSGMSFKVFFDYALFTQLWFRGNYGLEQFNAKGESTLLNCSGVNDCTAEISYFTADLWARYLFMMDSVRPWAGGGVAFLFPMSKEATAISTKSITNTSNFLVGAGLDWFFKKNMFLPFQVEYALYPSGKGVSSSSIAVRIGFGMEF